MGINGEIFSILLSFERLLLNIKIFNSAKNLNNQFLIILFGLNNSYMHMLKSYLHLYWLSLIDIIGVDLTKLLNYSFLFNSNEWTFNNQSWQSLIYYNFINYNTNERFIFTHLLTNQTLVTSITNIFNNAGWLERELVEFFNINIQNRTDTRNLLLDYNNNTNPLLKTFPTEGTNELFFNYLTYNLEYVETEFIEL